MAIISALGLMDRSRSCSTVVLACPMVRVVAISWRLILEMLTQSKSTMVRCMIPERINDSAHHEPTPPTPNRMTRCAAMSCIMSSPISSSLRWSMSLVVNSIVASRLSLQR